LAVISYGRRWPRVIAFASRAAAHGLWTIPQKLGISRLLDNTNRHLEAAIQLPLTGSLDFAAGETFLL
jgi:hypothetical protein